MPSDLLPHHVSGEGPPLVLLNGGMMTYAAWEPLAPALSTSCRLVRCDFRGQLLAPGDSPPTLAGHADDVLRLMDGLRIESAHVAGTSFGGLVALTLGAAAPARVRSLVVTNVTERVTQAMRVGVAMLRDACQEAIDGGDGGRVLDLVTPATWSPAFIEANATLLAARRQAVGLLPRAWFSGLRQLLTTLDETDLRPVLDRIACPALVIGGENDLTFPPGHSRAVAAGIPGARLVIMPGGSHGLAIERSAEVVDLLLGFVGEVERRSAP
jgi:pimeloyl-ACP methyl ester carboxylesterase